MLNLKNEIMKRMVEFETQKITRKEFRELEQMLNVEMGLIFRQKRQYKYFLV